MEIIRLDSLFHCLKLVKGFAVSEGTLGRASAGPK